MQQALHTPHSEQAVYPQGQRRQEWKESQGEPQGALESWGLLGLHKSRYAGVYSVVCNRTFAMTEMDNHQVAPTFAVTSRTLQD